MFSVALWFTDHPTAATWRRRLAWVDFVLHVPDWHWSQMFEQTQRVFDAVSWLSGEPARPAPLAGLVYR